MAESIFVMMKRSAREMFPNAFFRIHSFLRPFPEHFIVESTNFCNLSCLGCNNPYLKRKKQVMRLADFKKILPQLNEIGVRQVDFDFCGEPLLNKDVSEMARLAHESGISTFFSTNGAFIGEHADEIIKSGLDSILIDLDAVESKAYLKLRKGGNFGTVRKNIKLLCDRKKKLGSKTPFVALSYLITSYSEKTIPEAEKLAEKLGANRLVLKSMHSMIQDPGRLKGLLPTKKEYLRDSEKAGNWFCGYINGMGVILVNGDVGLCCADHFGDHVFGNVFKTPLREILKSPAYIERREKIFEKEYALCRGCVISQGYRKTIDFKENF
ncbi:MAG: radical SAM protein [Candidatus Diapherotrites archaeon]